MAWNTGDDDSVLIDITVIPLEGKCTFGTPTAPSVVSPGQTFTVSIPWSNTGAGVDRFKFVVSLQDPDTGASVVTDQTVTTGGIAVNVGQTLTSTFTLPTSYVNSHVKIHVSSYHESGFYV